MPHAATCDRLAGRWRTSRRLLGSHIIPSARCGFLVRNLTPINRPHPALHYDAAAS